jgi:hypothetical protein
MNLQGFGLDFSRLFTRMSCIRAHCIFSPHLAMATPDLVM